MRPYNRLTEEVEDRVNSPDTELLVQEERDRCALRIKRALGRMRDVALRSDYTPDDSYRIVSDCLAEVEHPESAE